jgi:hypothetical protein
MKKAIENQPSDSEDCNPGWPDSNNTYEVSNLSRDYHPNRYKVNAQRRITGFQEVFDIQLKI